VKKIMIQIDTSRASGRKFLRGVEKYMSAFTEWQVFVKPPDYLPSNSFAPEPWIEMDDVDGFLIYDPSDGPNIRKIDKPKVILCTQTEVFPGISTIVTGSQQIAQYAAEYLLDRGFRHFAFCGFKGIPWSEKRFESFVKTLEENGIDTVHRFTSSISKSSRRKTERNEIAEWLKELPKPLCVFACNDDRAVYVLEACKIAGLSVPQEVAILGVDNDELVCKLSSPPLSSIELNFEKIGFIAAQHLDELNQNKSQTKVISVEPIEVVTRQSTDTLAIEDEDIVKALIFIENNFRKPIQVPDVVRATCLSRRVLETRFKKRLKKTIKNEIERQRIQLIKKKLLSSAEPIYHISQDIEFTDPEHISRYFKNITGQSPQEFRRNLK
jgi:LacI family transcriptional regulator